MGKKLEVNVGDKYYRLTVVCEAKQNKGRRRFKCVCDCGKYTVVDLAFLRNGCVKSCGCLQRERASESKKTHGMSKHYLFPVWTLMVDRCENPESKLYKYYGARGISVCENWRGVEGFKNFIRDLEVRPNGYSLDRIDNDGNYEPSNCRWASKTQQVINRRVGVSNKTGVKGVYKDKKGNFIAQITFNYKSVYLGSFRTVEEASKARREAESKYHKPILSCK
jgi:hypothetical protein